MKKKDEKIGIIFLGEYKIAPIVERLREHMQCHFKTMKRKIYLNKIYSTDNVHCIRSITETALFDMGVLAPTDSYDLFYYDDVESDLETTKKIFCERGEIMKMEDLMIDVIPQGDALSVKYLLRMTHQPTNISVEDIVLYNHHLCNHDSVNWRLYATLGHLVDEHIQRQKDKLPLARCVESETI